MANDFSVTLTYQRRGTRPPLFVAGTFTDPPWVPQEMECTADKSGDITFSKTCVLEPGSDLQYKFRVGTGDWWVVDERFPTASDPQGNVNNVMRVPRPPESDPQVSPAINSDANGRRVSTASSMTFGDESGDLHHAGNGSVHRRDSGSIHQDSTTNLLKNSEIMNPGYGATSTSEQTTSVLPNGDTEAAADQPGVRRRNGTAAPATLGDDVDPVKAGEESWIARIWRRFWVDWVGGFVGRLFRRASGT